MAAGGSRRPEPARRVARSSGAFRGERAPQPTIRPWRVVSRGPEQDFRIFKLQQHVAVSPRTQEPRPIVVVKSDDWVNVVALTPEREVVLIEQYRHGIRRVTLEIPGGLIDSGESPEEAGVRELREETGYEGTEVSLLGAVHPNPAFLTNVQHTVLVRGAHRVGEPQLDSGEDIAVRLVPLEQIPALIRDGQITHSLVVTAFYWLWEGSLSPISAGSR